MSVTSAWNAARTTVWTRAATASAARASRPSVPRPAPCAPDLLPSPFGSFDTGGFQEPGSSLTPFRLFPRSLFLYVHLCERSFSAVIQPILTALIHCFLFFYAPPSPSLLSSSLAASASSMTKLFAIAVCRISPKNLVHLAPCHMNLIHCFLLFYAPPLHHYCHRRSQRPPLR